MNNETENLMLEKARTAFRESVAALDAGTLQRLRTARERALERAQTPSAFWRRPAWGVPLSAAAIVLAAVIGGLVWWNLNSQPAVPPFAANNGEDMAIVLSNDNLDMYADMDFYQWLQAQQQQSPGTQTTQTDSGGNNNG